MVQLYRFLKRIRFCTFHCFSAFLKKLCFGRYLFWTLWYPLLCHFCASCQGEHFYKNEDFPLRFFVQKWISVNGTLICVHCSYRPVGIHWESILLIADCFFFSRASYAGKSVFINDYYQQCHRSYGYMETCLNAHNFNAKYKSLLHNCWLLGCFTCSKTAVSENNEWYVNSEQIINISIEANNLPKICKTS